MIKYKIVSARDYKEASRGYTCGSSSSSVHANRTTPGLTKQQKLSTWPFTISSSPTTPFHSQMIFSRPRYSFRVSSIPCLPSWGFLDSCSRHCSVTMSVLQRRSGAIKKLNWTKLSKLNLRAFLPLKYQLFCYLKKLNLSDVGCFTASQELASSLAPKVKTNVSLALRYILKELICLDQRPSAYPGMPSGHP